jgi:hypothetical protein
MGGTSTKFKKHLQRGDEYAAMRVNIYKWKKKNICYYFLNFIDVFKLS